MTTPQRGARLFGAVVRPFQAFLRLEASSSILLLAAAVVAFAFANIDAASYERIVEYQLSRGGGSVFSRFTFGELVNDGLMTLFFFVVGMEIKRELAIGELDTVPKATLPAIAALGGMVVPAALYLAFNHGGPGQHGFGIPVATDIAFCVGVLTLLKNRVPRALVVFVTALAIFDDIGGIVVIALFYGAGLHGEWLLASAAITSVLFLLNRKDVRHGLAYAIAMAALWYALHASGIHATIAGVIAGLMVPVQPLQRFVHLLHPYVAYGVMPIFALVNSGVSLGGAGLTTLATPVAMGTALGLFLGKQLGIFVSTALAVRLGFAPMPGGAKYTSLYGVSIVAGIGFTVALFIATLGFSESPERLAEAKLGILAGSLASGLVGAALLRYAGAPTPQSPKGASEHPAPIAPAPIARRP